MTSRSIFKTVAEFLTCLALCSCTQGIAQQYPEMIMVQGGTFEMRDEYGWTETADRVHKVTLSTFSIAKTETTVLQWKTYCDATGRKMPEKPSWGWLDNHPVVNVSWEDAVAYCDWLSTKTGKIYRLPTEAEWEFSARGGQQSKGYNFSGSDTLDVVGWSAVNSESTHEVASKSPNELGLYDMSGNVEEWCMDRYEAYPSEAQTNPTGSKSGSSRVIRGGTWLGSTIDCRVACRGTSSQDYHTDFFGFRVVCSEH